MIQRTQVKIESAMTIYASFSKWPKQHKREFSLDFKAESPVVIRVSKLLWQYIEYVAITKYASFFK